MSYKEDQRRKIVGLRDKIFNDPGNGIYQGRQRDFVLLNPTLNLWEGIRQDAIDYFKKNEIMWWPGQPEIPTGHLLSSQVSCVNHLFFVRNNKDMATQILSAIDSGVDEACIVDNGYVEFEFIGERQYIKERAFTRGANCTSVDAVMIGLKADGTRKMFLIEWKYVESYSIQDKYKEARSVLYDGLILAKDSPYKHNIDLRTFYFEPFYQLMRQTLLADQCVKNADHNVSSYMHLHIVPESNIDLKNNITSPNLKGTDIHDAWKSLLKDSANFKAITPENFLEPIVKLIETKTIIAYLKNRYWD